MKFQISKKIIITFFLVVSVILLFTPYLFSEEKAFQGVSYMVGFNNRIAVLLLAVTALIPLYVGFRSNSTDIKCWNDFSDFKIDGTLLRTSLIIFLLIISFAFLFNSKNFYGFVEGGFFMHYVYALMYDVSLYSDVQFIYGPLSVYPVYWLTFLGLPVHYVYYFLLGVTHVLGLICTYYVLSWLNLSPRDKKIIFIIIAVLTFPTTHGFNNSLLRYTLTPFFIINYIFNYSTRSLSRRVLLSFLFPLLSFLFSPEIGLCYIFSSCLWLLVDYIIKKRKSSLIQVVIHLGVLLSILVSFPDYLSSIFQAGSGGSNFPWVPSLPIILLIVGVLTLSYAYGLQLKDIKNNYGFLSIETCFFALVLPGLGRCDPGHIMFWGLFVFVLSFIIIQNLFVRKHVIIFFTLCIICYYPAQSIIVKPFVSQLYSSNKDFITSLAEKYVNAELPYSDIVSLKLEKQKTNEDKNSIFRIIDGKVTSIGVSNDVYVHLHENYNYHDTYFGHLLIWIGTKAGFDREIEDLKSLSADYIVLPVDFENKWMSYNDYSILNLLFFTYYPIKPYRTYNDALYGGIINYLEDNYIEVAKDNVVTILKRRK